jgi:hypothetical protein
MDSVSALGILNGLFAEHGVRADKHRHALIWARLVGGRKSSDVAEVYALLFDFDGTVDSALVEELLRRRGITYLIHSSYSNGAAEKFRVIVFLSTPIPLHHTATGTGIGPDGYRRLYRAAVIDIFGVDASKWVDPNCCNASRLFYIPARPPCPDASPFIRCSDGKLFDWRSLWETISDTVPPKGRRRPSNRTTKRLCAAGAGTDELRTHLQFLEPEEYRDWLLGLMVIRNESGGSEEGLALAHEWSSRSEKYDPAAVDAKWHSLSDNRQDKCMLGSLIWRIRQDKPNYLKGSRNLSALSREELDAAYSAM